MDCEPLETRMMLSASLDGRRLLIEGTARGDVITVQWRGNVVEANVNGSAWTFDAAAIREVQVRGGARSDRIVITGIGASVLGGPGDDTLAGGSFDDVLIGGRGDDLLEGRGGNDQLLGGRGRDRLIGGGGDDEIDGHGGRDLIASGGDADRVRASAQDVLDHAGAALARPASQMGAAGDASPAFFNGTVTGYSPDQVRAAYGFGDLDDGSFDLRGQGQRIAIIVAHHYPTAKADLNTFSKEFGLPTVGKKQFRTVFATGKEPSVDPAWAAEAALDVQWAHAIAPLAKIYLVEAESALFTDLFVAVDKAVELLGAQGGVVSMSFGAGEFGGADEFEDSFARAAGRVSFVAAAGDSPALVHYPAASPYVVGVGGTSLDIDAGGNRIFPESAWDSGGGGTSSVFRRPKFQNGLVVEGKAIGKFRVSPDVAYNGDPFTGVAVYNTTPDFNGDTGWAAIGGTSSGTPQWAGLITLANLNRLRGSRAPLVARTLNGMLYNIAGRKGQTEFTDITEGSNGFAATEGFDRATGWGVPDADALIDQLFDRASDEFIRRFSWGANFTRPFKTALAASATASFSGIGTADVDANAADAVFGRVKSPDGFINITNVNLTRDSTDSIDGTATATVSLTGRVGGTFTIRIRGRVFRSKKVDHIRGEFWAINARGDVLRQSGRAVLSGSFESTPSHG